MGRRSIKNEAEQRANDQDQNESDDGDSDETEADDERVRHTQRIPSDLDEEIEAWADRRDMSKNAAINHFAREFLDE